MERKAKRLAAKLFFKLDRQGIRYSLRRTAGVSGIVRRENLSLDEVERELDMWIRSEEPHGGPKSYGLNALGFGRPPRE